MEKHIIKTSETIKKALQLLNALTYMQNAALVLLVQDEKKKVVGTLTDGDIRRGLMQHFNVDTKVEKLMNRSFHFLIKDKYTITDINALKAKGIWSVPVLTKEMKVCKILNLRVQKSKLPLDALIMAGGRGQRLMPLTKNVPKPMLKVGGKPIIETNIDRLIKYGIENINLSINYLGNVIESYFDKKEKSCRLNYVKEGEPLGTIGSITLIDKIENDYVLLMNSDLLTDIDFEDMFNEMLVNKADMIVASIPHRVAIPYAVFETEGREIMKLTEKPTYTYHSNAGIYIFKKSCIKYVPKNEHFNATDLLEKMIKKKHKVVYYDVVSYWLDIGSPEDFQKAQTDYLHLNL